MTDKSGRIRKSYLEPIAGRVKAWVERRGAGRQATAHTDRRTAEAAALAEEAHERAVQRRLARTSPAPRPQGRSSR
ncbi:MAG: hypothetical protein SW019_11025 [Actinomycetota bacterium]|nr:hypothetical protein [Actinomycetota bacterium]